MSWIKLTCRLFLAAMLCACQTTQLAPAHESLQLEAAALDRAPAPDPSSKPYFHYSEQKNDDGTRSAQIAGKVLIFDAQDNNHLLANLQDAVDLRKLEIMAEQVIVRTPIRLPGTEVHIAAEELRFEDSGEARSLIDTTPRSQLAQAEQFKDGVDGLKAGDVHVFVRAFVSEQNRFPRFVMKGGNGQQAGTGLGGGSGTSAPTFQFANPALLKCGRDNGIASIENGRLVPAAATVDELQLQAIELGAEWPTDGEDAKPGGKPGDAGDGGSFFANLPGIAPFAQMQAGTAGREAGFFFGGASGHPDPATRLASAQCQRFRLCAGSRICRPFDTGGAFIRRLIVAGVERREIENGKNVTSPRADRRVGTNGTAHVVPGEFSYYHPLALSMSIAFAEDAFANDFFDLARAELEKQAAVLGAYEASPEWNAASDDDRTLLGQHALRVRSLLSRLNSHEDFYGNPLGWVPALSLEANKLLFETEVQWAIRSLFVADWLSDLNQKQKDHTAALIQARTLLRSEIDELQRTLDTALASLPALQVKALDATTHIDELNAKLQILEGQLAERAQNNVEEKHKLPFWKKGLKVLAIIAKSLPVAQPILRGIGVGLDTIADFDSERPWASVTAVKDSLATFAASDAAKKAADAAKKVAEEKPQDKKTKATLKQSVRKLKEFLGPVATALAAQKQLFLDAEVPKDEVTAELARLKQEDPMFLDVTNRAAAILAEREQLAAALAESMQASEHALTSISEHYLELAELLPELEGSAAVILSQRSEIALKDMRSKAMHRLHKYQYLLARSFEYRMLRKYPGDLTLTNMLNEMQHLVAASDSNGVLNAADFERLYTLYRNELSEVVEQVAEAYNSGVSQNTVPVEYELNTAELAQLNAGQPVSLDFWEKGAFRPNEHDVRIVALEVSQLEVETHGTLDSLAYVDLATEHSGESRIWRDGQVHNFKHYNKQTQVPLRWASRWQNGTLTHHQLSASSQSLLRSLIEGDDVDLLLFSRPAAWASLRLTKSVNAAELEQFELHRVRVKLTYDYTLSAAERWIDYRSAQNGQLNSAFQRLLQRAPDVDELTVGRLMLDKGYSGSALDELLMQVHEGEFFSVVVENFYASELGRAPNTDERGFWAKELMNGRPEPEVRQYARLISETVFEVFQRLPNYSELEQFTSLLDSGVPLN